MVKNPPAKQEIQVQSLGQEDTLEKEMATHFSILPGKCHGQRSLAGYSPYGYKESDTTFSNNNLPYLAFIKQHLFLTFSEFSHSLSHFIPYNFM